MTLWSWWDVKIRELTNKPCMGRMVERKINWSVKRKWEWNVRICGQSVRQWQSLMFSYQSCMSRILPHQCFVHWLPCFDFYLFFSSSLFFAHWNVFFLLSKVSVSGYGFWLLWIISQSVCLVLCFLMMLFLCQSCNCSVKEYYLYHIPSCNKVRYFSAQGDKSHFE